MKQYDQLGDFRPSTRHHYQEVQCQKQTQDLYIHKLGFKNILVRLPKARKRIHDWRLKTIQVTQYSIQKGSSQKAVAEIVFDGEMIFSLIDIFNQKMGKQILEYVDSISPELREWCQAPIKNVFLVTQRAEQSLGFKHGFIKITPVLFHENRYFYFQYRRWLGSVQSYIPCIQSEEHIKGSSNYSRMFDQVCRSIHKQRKQKYLRMLQQKQRKLKKVQFVKQPQQPKKYEEQQQEKGQQYMILDKFNIMRLKNEVNLFEKSKSNQGYWRKKV